MSRPNRSAQILQILLVILILSVCASSLLAQARQQAVADPPPRAEGEGPFETLILYGATIIDGTGALPNGPVAIIIKNNRIDSVRGVGIPGMPLKPAPVAEEGQKVVDCSGLYILPGFVDVHEHIGSTSGIPAEYVYKLWLGHGITTVREVGARNSLDWLLGQKEKSANNEITAPRLFAYPVVGGTDPEKARAYVKHVADKGADGVKIFGLSPKVYNAVLDEVQKNGIRSASHLSQSAVGRTTTLDLARLGATSMEHWYGLPESMLAGSTIQDWPLDAVYGNEQDRFGNAGRLWSQAAAPYSEKWNAVMNELIELDFSLVPTLTIYEASRDLMRARRAEWHEEYTLPVLWRFYEPSRTSHGAYWFNWTTADEIAWKNNYKLWMTFLNEYNNRGGRVAVGSDSGFIYNLWGFGFIREFELLQEAGFHPLEVIRAATLRGAELLGQADNLGTIEPGKFADLVVLGENPLENFKTLYGVGAIRLNDENVVERVGGVIYTIKDGIIYDAKQLLADVRAMVQKAKEDEDFEIVQPGMKK